MKFNTIRNVMMSMLVLGVAGSVVGMGSGTFASFNAVTTSTNNTFSTASITFSDTNNGGGGGGTCTSTAGATGAPTAACNGATSWTIQGTTLVAGDSKTAFTTLNNGGNVPVTTTLSVADVGSDNITSTGIGTIGATTAADALGLLIFECRDSSSHDVACSGAVTQLYTVYGSCGTSSGAAAPFATVTQAGAFTSSHVVTTGVTDNGIKIGTGADGVCYAGNTGSTALKLLTNQAIVAATGSPTVNNTNPLAITQNDHLAIVMYLPVTADNSAQAKTATSLTFTWTANQLAGASS